MSSKKKPAIGEIITWCVGALFILGGLSLIILGVVGTYLNVPADENPIVQTQATLQAGTGMGYRWWGVIFLLIGALIATISLCYFAKKEDRDSERSARRRERMSVRTETPIEVAVGEPTPKAEE